MPRFFPYSRSAAQTSADLAAAARLARAIVAAGGASKTHDAIEGYVERAKAALPALGNVPARAELGTLADGLARDSSRRTR